MLIVLSNVLLIQATIVTVNTFLDNFLLTGARFFSCFKPWRSQAAAFTEGMKFIVAMTLSYFVSVSRWFSALYSASVFCGGSRLKF